MIFRRGWLPPHADGDSAEFGWSRLVTPGFPSLRSRLSAKAAMQARQLLGHAPAVGYGHVQQHVGTVGRRGHLVVREGQSVSRLDTAQRRTQLHGMPRVGPRCFVTCDQRPQCSAPGAHTSRWPAPCRGCPLPHQPHAPRRSHGTSRHNGRAALRRSQAAPVTDLAGQLSVKTLGCRQRDTPSVGRLWALSSLACCCSANLSAASLLEKVATTRPLASPSLTSNTGPSWVTRYVLMALNMTWMQRRPKRAVRDSPSLRRELSAIICSRTPRPPGGWPDHIQQHVRAPPPPA